VTALRLVALVAAVVAGAGVYFAVTASNTVPATRAARITVGSIGANELQPPECRSALGSTLTAIVRGGVNNVSLTHTLLLGTNGNDTIKLKNNGSAGNCLIGGAGTDTFTVPAGNGTEVCILNAASQGRGSLAGCTSVVTRP
jgi:Ca2+-binding RTX toxin-like protein